ncbi:MAG: ribonucleoside-diphosphate reductase subunit alpha [Rhodospirillaceae bacterium]|nr:ribonucleoside-diphosphate reductase subunit alpha [Rhodospirillaceae bacterium]
MQVVTRSGKTEPVRFDKITDRLTYLSTMPGLSEHLDVDPAIIVQLTATRIKDGITTRELDELTSNICMQKIMVHPDYGILGARIAIDNHHKITCGKFGTVVERLATHLDILGEEAPLISQEIVGLMADPEKREKIESWIDYNRDFRIDCFGFKTIERGYLLRSQGAIQERPGDMYMRVALGIHGWDRDGLDARETYDAMSQGFFIHATPTLFHAGTPYPQMSSCFLMGVEDSVQGIYKGLADAAMISKHAGGLGIHCHEIRAKGSYIRKTGGTSTGLIPFLKVYNDTARYIDQGGGKRKGSFAMYLEPHHPDILDFLGAKRPQGTEETKARDLFYALWISDLFMQRVKKDEDWSLFCPNQTPGLSDVVGDEYRALYEKYESEGREIKKVKARRIWDSILESQIETGGPYMLYKDAANMKSNQQNLGVIKSSNLCCEILEYSDHKEYAVCNLASIALPSFVKDDNKTPPLFCHEELGQYIQILVHNLNKVIDRNYYPLPETEVSNMRHRPIGLGVQGLADTFIKMKLPFDSPEARILNKEIFETIYFNALCASNEIAGRDGTYETYQGSPASRGIFQFDMWNVDRQTLSTRHDWKSLFEKVSQTGLRNSLLLAPMPTASTSQILGYNECIEPFTSNIYTRRTLAGEFVVINKYLIRELIKLELWSEELKHRIMFAKGSVQKIPTIPENVRLLFKTAWELKQKVILDMAADRGAFICQSQSLNVFVEEPTTKILNSIHFYGWSRGLKTGTYYIRSKPAASAQNFTMDPKLEKKLLQEMLDENAKREENECVNCSA